MNKDYAIGKGRRERIQWRKKKMMEEGDYVACQFSATRFLNVSLVSTDVEYPTDLISQGAKVMQISLIINIICQGLVALVGFFIFQGHVQINI